MKFWKPLQAALEFLGDKDIAAQQKAYMRDQFDYYGCKMPTIKSALSEFLKDNKAISWTELKDQVIWTWKQPQREWQMVGMFYLQKMKKLWQDDLVEFAEVLITEKSWWDTVDFLASNVVGKFLEKKSELAEEKMNQWNQSDDMWKVRTSIIFQLKYKAEVNKEFLAKAILRHEDSTEFFIRKAQGWALRQYSRFNPEWVGEFLEQNQKLSGLTKREGGKFL